MNTKSKNIEGIALTALALLLVAPAFGEETGSGNPSAGSQARATNSVVEEVLVTARRRDESAQDVPIALSVVSGDTLDSTGTYSVSRIAQLAPTFQYIASNPRNTNFTIRGLGTSFGLANDGLEPGVGLYVDDVYFARPAAASFDLLDVDRVEILRGPQGTLFGKNTTAGALNVTTRAPSFDPEGRFELSADDDGLLQGKASVSGGLIDDVLAGRLSGLVTLRDGSLDNVTTGKDNNEQDNKAIRGKLLFQPTETLSFTLAGDFNEQRTECCTQVFVVAGQTLKPAAQQFPALAAAAGYTPASLDPFDRKADVNSDIQANQELGGVSLVAEWDIGDVTLTSISAWRYWNWDPANDRDYMSLSVLTQSANPDEYDQYTQEVRLASNGDGAVNWIVGVYGLTQTIEARPSSEYGADATRWLLTPLTLPENLLDGYRSDAETKATTDSYAAFAQVTWNITDRLEFTPGVRYTHEYKDGRYDQVVSGGLETSDPVLIARKLSIVRPQSYDAEFDDSSVSGQLNLAYRVTDDVTTYVNYASGFKSGGINMAGIPNDAAGNPSLTNAVVEPEEVKTIEIGIKTQLFDGRATANLAVFDTQVDDYQANVVDTGPGALRGYLANVEEVSVRGVELDFSAVPFDGLNVYSNVAWTDSEYESFPNGPCPLELIGTTTVSCDLSGQELPGLSEWAAAVGGEYGRETNLFGRTQGEVFVGLDSSYRSSFSSDASNSKYMQVDSYVIVNARVGYRTFNGAEFYVWSTNLLDENYFTLMSAQAGNSGAVLGVPGDPRAVGATFRVSI